MYDEATQAALNSIINKIEEEENVSLIEKNSINNIIINTVIDAAISNNDEKDTIESLPPLSDDASKGL